MNMARRFNSVACLAVLAAAMSYCVADAKPILAVLVVLAVAAGWWAGSTTPGRALPRYLVNILVLVAIIHAASVTMRPIASVVSNLAEFLIYIQLIKLFDRRTARDDGHLLTLSVFIVIGSVLTSNNLGVGLLVLLYTPLAIGAAMLLQLHAGHTAAMSARPPAERGAVPPPSVGRGYRRDFRLSASGAVVSSIVLAAAAFLFTPRGMGENLLGGFGRIGGQNSVGFTDQIHLGQSGFLNPGDQTPVLEMKLLDADDHELGDRLGPIYLRAAARDQYHERSWMTSSEAGARRRVTSRAERSLPFDAPAASGLAGDPPPALDSQPIVQGDSGPPQKNSFRALMQDLDTVPPGTPLIKQRIVLRHAPNLTYFFALWRPVRIAFEEEIAWTRGPHMELQRVRGSPGPLTYTVVSARTFTDPDEQPRDDVHFDSQRIRDLALNLLAQRAVPADPRERDEAANHLAAALFQNHLRLHYAYTLEMTAPEHGEDPIEMFLFRTKRGHCEYFASALVAMCQSVGLDARVAMGYLASEFNPVAGVYVVRQSSAHAWAEVNVSPGRWVTFDASPTDEVTRLGRPSRGVLGRIRQFYDALEFTWVNAVVTFDESKRSGLVGGFDSWPIDMGRLSDFLARVGELIPLRPRYVLPPFWVIPGVLVAAIAFAIELRILRARRRARAARAAKTAQQIDPAVRRMLEQASFYTDALATLERAGLGKPDSTPPLRHAAALSAQRPEVAVTLGALARLYYAVRFGHRPLTPEQLDQARAALARLRALVSAGPSPAGSPA